jgi:hypothetical protein
MTLRSGTRATIRNVIQQDFSVMTLNVGWIVPTILPAAEWPSQLSIENSFFWNNGPFVDAPVTTPLTSDDNGFNEELALKAPERNNKFDVDPKITSIMETAPNYSPTNAALNGQAVPPVGMDQTATYAGAVAPNMPSWTEGWTKFPAN